MIRIYYRGKLIGVKVGEIKKGSIPITEVRDYIQMVTLKHAKGTSLKAHMHSPRSRQTKRLQECMIVKKGKVRLDLYASNKKLFKHVFLTTGQAFILFEGGIGVKFITNAEIFEVKNGPFKEDKVLI
jgi:hypothetical protein